MPPRRVKPCLAVSDRSHLHELPAILALLRQINGGAGLQYLFPAGGAAEGEPLLEKDAVFAWQPCYLIPFSTEPRPVALRPILSNGLPFSSFLFSSAQMSCMKEAIYVPCTQTTLSRLRVQRRRLRIPARTRSSPAAFRARAALCAVKHGGPEERLCRRAEVMESTEGSGPRTPLRPFPR